MWIHNFIYFFIDMYKKYDSLMNKLQLVCYSILLFMIILIMICLVLIPIYFSAH